LIYLLDKRLRNKRKILYDAPYGFPEIHLNLGMRDIEDISLYPLFPEWGTLTCKWAKPTADQVTLLHDSLIHRAYLSLWVPRNIDILYLPYLSNQESRKTHVIRDIICGGDQFYLLRKGIIQIDPQFFPQTKRLHSNSFYSNRNIFLADRIRPVGKFRLPWALLRNRCQL